MPNQTARIYAVSEVTHYIKHVLEDDHILSGLQVVGEVSNLTYHSSGHVYFSIKDQGAQLSCVMFRSYAQQAPRIQAGDRVILQGSISVYAPRGHYQLMVHKIQKEGTGDLFQRFLALKEKLKNEGLFDEKHKKSLPFLPRTIAILTSPTGAAIRDILQTLKRRFEGVKVILLPTVVQGPQGAPAIIKNLEQATHLNADLLILGRGGGSIEDLWNFNEESVARAIFACPIPIIVGIGHETDFTIADFVADVRASTPTAAAERSVPDKQALQEGLVVLQRQMEQSLQHYIDFKRQVLDDYSYRLQKQVDGYLQQKRHEVALLSTQLASLDVKQRLQQGYTLTLKGGKVLQHGAEILTGETLETIFSDKRITSTVTATQDSNL